jgi:hypothetical protein
MTNHLEVEVEDTKEVIRIHKSKKNRQHNVQKKKDKRTNNNLQNMHIKLMIDYHDLVDRYGIFASQMTMDMFHVS